ncbi:MAG: hypothetical protein U9R74_08995, partial [Pseudomonadota bacterium]|nr:hypothetical protein [Pseudomonadota bacterium]
FLTARSAGSYFAAGLFGIIVVPGISSRYGVPPLKNLPKLRIAVWNALESCGCLDEIESEHVFQGKTAAIHAIYQKLDKSICAGCDKRIFTECQSEFGPGASTPGGVRGDGK